MFAAKSSSPTINGPIQKREIDRVTSAHLTENWRRTIDNKQVVGVLFIDFQKAFDCVSHSILLRKLQHNFGISGDLLAWLKDYLMERKQYSAINGLTSKSTTYILKSF